MLFAKFPYEEDTNIIKERPVIILNVEPLEVLSVKVTHHDVRNTDDYDIPITKWKECGLRQPSVARISKTIYLSNDMFVDCIGQLHSDDIKTIYYTFTEFISKNE